MSTTELAKLRAVLLTVIDEGWTCEPPCGTRHPYHFDPYDESEEETNRRLRFCDRVVAAMEKGNDG